MKTLKNNKGFTLIEIVIVIVIIAILAAMLVPSMLSWIDSANQRTFLSAADSIKTSTLTTISNQYATGTVTADTIDWAEVSELVGANINDEGTTGTEYEVEVTLDGNQLETMTIVGDGYAIKWLQSATAWGEVVDSDETPPEPTTVAAS